MNPLTWQGSPERIKELRAMLSQVLTATDSEIGPIYLAWIGHDPVAEGEVSADEARAILRDYVKELCYAEGVHCSEVFDEGDE